ncbi:asparaginase [Leptolyngbya ohadii]|uniref:asparaginase n=1 Tax=Leptolyngbya ohadii TaxID=1962290 RepID=UPI000B59C43E|nr:asparaginase [Leptolyngbya ohadii]
MRKVVQKLIQRFPLFVLVAVGLVVFLLGRTKAQAVSIAAITSPSPAVEIVSQAIQQTAPASTGKPLVKIVATGGTIANSPQGRLAVENVLNDIPQIGEVATVEIKDYARIGSSAITLQNWIDIANIINDIEANEPEVDGIVVTHGSNTAEETAYFLNLVVKGDKPVVITGAQRQQNTLGEEGDRNLYDAIRVAASPEAKGHGVMLVVNDMIHAARDVTKTLSYRVETWDSGDLGALGLVDTDRVVFYRNTIQKHTSDTEFSLAGIANASQLPRVDILYAYAGADRTLVDAAINQGQAKGLIIAGFPTGSPTPAMREALNEAVGKGIPVVMSHRGGRGRIRVGENFISADNLTPQKARILLMMALTKSTDPAAIQKIFTEY